MTRVAVLYGGISAEREVSLSTGLQVIPALREAGFDVTPIEVDEDIGAVITALTPRPDAVFNALHGRFGEDGAIQRHGVAVRDPARQWLVELMMNVPLERSFTIVLLTR